MRLRPNSKRNEKQVNFFFFFSVQGFSEINDWNYKYVLSRHRVQNLRITDGETYLRVNFMFYSYKKMYYAFTGTRRRAQHSFTAAARFNTRRKTKTKRGKQKIDGPAALVLPRYNNVPCVRTTAAASDNKIKTHAHVIFNFPITSSTARVQTFFFFSCCLFFISKH